MNNEKLNYEYYDILFSKKLLTSGKSQELLLIETIEELNLRNFDTEALERIKQDVECFLKVKDNSNLIDLGINVLLIFVMICVFIGASMFFHFGSIMGVLSSASVCLILRGHDFVRANKKAKKINQRLREIKEEINLVIKDRERIQNAIDIEEIEDKEKVVVTKDYVNALIWTLRGYLYEISPKFAHDYEVKYCGEAMSRLYNEDLTQEELEQMANLLERAIIKIMGKKFEADNVKKDNLNDDYGRIFRK